MIVYLRASKTDPIASERAFADQQARLSRWLAEKSLTVAAQFIEVEGQSPSRPRLVEAIDACRELGLPLAVASIQPIGAGPSFSPRIASVAVIVLPQPSREPPQIIACPSAYREEVCLHVGKMVEGRLPLFLCNPKKTALTNVTVRGAGLQLGTAELARTCPSTRCFARIEPRTCALLEQRDVNLEGDFLDCLRVAFDDAGVRRTGAVLLRNLLQVNAAIRIAFDPR